MAVSDWMKPGFSQKSRVKILTVDKVNRRVEAALKDGAMIQIAIWEVPPLFRWPQVEENWTVYKQNGYWMLDAYTDQDSNVVTVEDLDDGQARIAADSVVLSNGDVMAVQADHDALQAEVDRLDGGLVVALPSSPVDGQQIQYLADATHGVIWTLRYRAASVSAYKWECIGGGRLRAYVQTSESSAGDGVTRDLATVGPSITLPLAGDYEYEFFANAFFTSTATNTLTTITLTDGANAVINSGTEFSQANIFTPGAAGGIRAELKRSNTIFSRTAATAVKMRYSTTDQAVSFRERTLYIKPVRVG